MLGSFVTLTTVLELFKPHWESCITIRSYLNQNVLFTISIFYYCEFLPFISVPLYSARPNDVG